MSANMLAVDGFDPECTAVSGRVHDHPWLDSHDDPWRTRIELAREAQRGWAAKPVEERAACLGRAIGVLVDELDEIADLIHEENGKPRVEAIGHEIGSSIDCIRFLVKEGPRVLKDEVRGLGWMVYRRARLEKVPHGVALVISPWNFPLSIPLGQVVACLLAGNAVVLKPSEFTPLIARVIERALAPCRLPPGLFTIVEGDGQVGAALIDARPDKVFFTGSVATGRRVMAAAARHPIPVSLELGGVDALIVCADADLELASSAALWGGVFNGGQVCASVERILVHAAVAEQFRDRLARKLEELDSIRDLGRVTVPAQRRVYERHLDDARARGLRTTISEQRVPANRCVPTLVDGDEMAASSIFTEESFGPLLAMATFRDERQLLALHEATRFGLSASIFSENVAEAERLAGALKVGLVSINDVAATLHAFGGLPWGGSGESGFGRSHGEAGLLECVTTKVIERNRPGIPNFKRPWWYPYDEDQLRMLAGFTRLTGMRGLGESARALPEIGLGLARMMRRNPRV
jgi:succinate-semialdehyde dehydrogenase/glutarate-semialdehyde dehydrogenase